MCAQADVRVGHFVATLGALGLAASGWPWGAEGVVPRTGAAAQTTLLDEKRG